MRVLLVSPHFPPAHVGGVEYYAQRLAAWLDSKGCEPAVVCVERVTAAEKRVVHAEVDDHYGYPVYRLDVGVKPGAHGFRLHWQHPALEEWIGTLLSRARPDILHLHSGYLLGDATLAAARAGHVPTIVTLHDLWFLCPRMTMMHPDMSRCSGPDDGAKCAWCLLTEQRRFRLPDRWTSGAIGRVAKLALRTWPVRNRTSWGELASAVTRRQRGALEALASAQAILSPSRFVRTQLERAGFEPGRIRIVPYGIGPCRPPRRERPKNPGVLRIGYLGQLAPHKGVHVLIAAARSLRSSAFELRLAGPTDAHVEYMRTLRQMAASDPRIRFTGAYDNDHVGDLLARLDVVIVPSVWHENWPFVVLEAFRAGAPVIASGVGGLTEMIRHDVDGLLFDPGSHVDLAHCLQRLLDDPLLLPRLRNGIQPVRSDEDEQADLLDIYARAAESSQGAHSV